MGSAGAAAANLDGDSEEPADADGEEPTLALLSELNRLWRADPVAGASHSH